jgi:hypothetical protein
MIRYIVRNKEGQLIATVPENTPKQAIATDRGRFVNYQQQGKDKIRAVEMTDDVVLEFEGHKVFLWRGYRMHPENY